MSADLLAAGRRRQIWNADGAAARAPGFVIGRFAAVARATGRVALTVWSPVHSDAPLDSAARLVAAAWAWNARSFGTVMAPEVNLVVGAAVDRGLPGLVLLTDSSADDALIVYREVARTWWGGAVRATGDAAWLEAALPVWSALASGRVGFTVQDAERVWRETAATAPLAQFEPASQAELEGLAAKGVMAIEALRTATGNARFRVIMRTLALDHRGRSLSAQDLVGSLNEPGQARLREFLY